MVETCRSASVTALSAGGAILAWERQEGGKSLEKEHDGNSSQ